jgi:signal transduction histidine kinase
VSRAPSPRRGGLRVRVTAAAALVTLLVAALMAAVFVRALQHDLEASLLEGAAQQASSVAARLAGGATAADAVASGRDDVVVQVVEDGRLLATDQPGVERVLLGRVGEQPGVDVPELGDSFAVATVAADDRLVTAGVAEEGLRASLRSSAQLVALGVPLVVLLVAVVVWVAVGRSLRPVEDMRSEAEAITLAHLHRRLPQPPGDDGIARLATTLNRMLDRIDDGQRRQRQFVSDASHELRSPLAVLRQVVEVAERHPEGTTVAALAAEVGEEERRMEQLVEALLVLARLDDGHELPVRLVDLDDLVHLAVERQRRTHPELVVDRTAVGAGQVRGDEVLLGQVVGNLLANASRHARSSVAVSLAEEGGRVVLAVDDDGPGIAPQDRARVFDRFVRLDEARARDAGGVGLGLAIVSDVVVLHGGTVHVERAPLGGARFVVDLPAAGGD